MTYVEKTLWNHLRLHQFEGYKFRRQQPIGNYIADFVCFEKRLIIEVDGGQHAERVEYDSSRKEWLEGQGFRILRFWNNQVLKEIEGVKEVVMSELRCQSPHLNPPPQRGRK
jgi:very-short-patch-repair endonuclease